MSVQPLIHDRDFGYVVAINPGQQEQWGQRIEVEFADGRTIEMDHSYLGTPLRNAVIEFLLSQSAQPGGE